MSKEFGDRVCSLLKEQGITQKELADVIGVTETAMSRYMQGSREPKTETIANIATVLKTTSDYLLGIEEKDEEVGFPRVKRLIARNSANMTNEQKQELIQDILASMKFD